MWKVKDTISKKKPNFKPFSTRVIKPYECFTFNVLKLSSLGVIGLTLATWVDQKANEELEKKKIEKIFLKNK